MQGGLLMSLDAATGAKAGEGVEGGSGVTWKRERFGSEGSDLGIYPPHTPFIGVSENPDCPT